MSPLKKGKSKSIIGKNIGEMVKSGNPKANAVAASLKKSGKIKKKKIKK